MEVDNDDKMEDPQVQQEEDNKNQGDKTETDAVQDTSMDHPKEGAPDDTPDDDSHHAPTQLTFIDHFSLRGPSSTVRFRGTKVTIYEQSGDEQFILEEKTSTVTNADGELQRRHHITAKTMRSGSFGLQILRVGYTLVAALMLGFLFVLCFQILLFLFVNLPVTVGGTAGSSLSTLEFLGTVLSVPLFLHAMGSVMAYATSFVTDTWMGHPLFRDMMEWPDMLEEWIAFVVFLFCPVATIVVLLFIGHQRWWEISSYTWMVCVFCFFLFFSLVLLTCEVQACLETVALIERQAAQQTGATPTDRHALPWWKLMMKSVLLTQRQRFSGVREERYLVHGAEAYPVGGYTVSEAHTPEQTRVSLYTRITNLLARCGLFELLDPAPRVYSVEEIRDIVPFVTRANWSLEKTFCLSGNSRVIYATTGPQALEPDQARSSLVCTGLGLLLLTLLFAAVLVWFGAQSATEAIVFSVVLFYCCSYPTIRSSWNVFRTYENMREVDRSVPRGGEDDENDETVADVLFQVWESVAITRPKDWYCWVLTGLEATFLFVWPLIVLATTGQYPILILFVFLGTFSALRVFCDASFVLSELGSLSDLDLFRGDAKDDDKKEEGNSWMSYPARVLNSSAAQGPNRTLLAKARTSTIVGNITRSYVAGRWRALYAIMALGILFLFALASNEEVTIPRGGRPPIVQVSDFYYEGSKKLPYPSCKMTNTFGIPGANDTTARLGDFSYLAALAYETQDVSQHYLDTWFGEEQLVDEEEFVAQWRTETGTLENPVFFKLYSFRNLPGYGIVSIRGSQTKTDFLVDAQLWSSAFLAQIVRAFIPFGYIWSSILDDLVRVVNFVESASIKKVSYYKVTTSFVNDVIENNWTFNGKSFHTLRVTGASLGGGLAIITGAQTNASAIAISGLNGRLSRRTFEPQVTLEALDTNVFNVIPDRDIIAAVGDRSRLFQQIECHAPLNSLFGCHSMWRTACELSHVCGTENRPVMCQCAEKFGYEEPKPLGNRTFTDACREERLKLEEALPGSFQ